MKKARVPAGNIDQYIARFPPDVQAVLAKVRLTIRQAAPTAQETVAYGIPTFILNGNLVHFGAFQKHLGFYPTSSGIAKFQPELSAYKSARGSVQFPFDKLIPYPLIARIVKFRVRESLKKAR